MNNTLQKALYVILISLGLALVFNFLFFGKMIGISVVIFVLIFLGVIALFGSQNQLSLKKHWWIVALTVIFALMLAIRASEFLSFLNVVATFGLLMLLAYQINGKPVILMRLWDYIMLAVLVPFRMLARGLSSVLKIGQIHSNVKNRDVWLRVAKGIIMALPILIIFAVLFSQADLAFSQFLKNFVNINISERTAQHTVLIVFAFVAALSFLSYIFFPKAIVPAAQLEQSEVPAASGRGIEVLVFLGLIATLFLVFIGFQINYLFGGEANITNAGFTYAEYARRGFFELLAVAALSLLLLLAAEKYAGIEKKSDKKFLIPALILIGEVAVIIVSAFKRLSLYIDAYGMTMMRFYVAGAIILLLALFVLLAYKFIKSKPEQFFTFGTLLAVLSFLLVVNVINPDAFIIQSNIDQYNETGKLDVPYIGGLSADAVPGKIELYNKLEGQEKADLGTQLQEQEDKLQRFNENWQSWNLSRSRALTLLKEIE